MPASSTPSPRLEALDGGLEIVGTGPVGQPLGNRKSGFRIVTVTPTALKHRYVVFGDVPETLSEPPLAARP